MTHRGVCGAGHLRFTKVATPVYQPGVPAAPEAGKSPGRGPSELLEGTSPPRAWFPDLWPQKQKDNPPLFAAAWSVALDRKRPQDASKEEADR